MKDYDIFPISQKKYILAKIENSRPKFEELLDKSYNYFKLFDKKLLTNEKYENEILKIFEFSVFLCLSWLNISASVKFYLTSNDSYGRTSSLTNLTIYLNESYKRLHHFVNSKTKDSLWVKNISEIIKNESFLEFKDVFEKISNDILDYENEYQNDRIKYERNIFVHYQGSPIEVYETYNNIDILTLIQNTTKYLNLTSEIIKFTTKLIESIRKNYYS